MSYATFDMHGHSTGVPYVQPPQSASWPNWDAFAAENPTLAEAIRSTPMQQQQQQQQQQHEQPRTFPNSGPHHQPIHFNPPPHAPALETAGRSPVTAPNAPSNLTSTNLNGAMQGHYPMAYNTHPSFAHPDGAFDSFVRQPAQPTAYPPMGMHMGPMQPQPPMGYPPNHNGVHMPPAGSWENGANAPVPSPTVSFRPSQPNPSQPQPPTSPPAANSVYIAPQPPTSPTSGTGPKEAKRRRKPQTKPEEQDRDSDDDDEGAESPAVDRRASGAIGGQRRACGNCKKAKVKCVPSPGGGRCKKCRTADKECTIEERKPPRNPNRREYFLAQIKERDMVIESLLRQLYDPYQATPLSIKTYRETAQHREEVNAAVRIWRERLEAGAKSHIPASPAVPTNGAHADEDEDFEDVEPEHASALKGNAKESPLDEVYPVAYFEELTISKEDGKSSSEGASSGEDTDDVASTRQNNMFDHRKSELLNHGIINDDDVEALFTIYHDKLNSFIPVLDRHLHTPKEVFNRCPPLFSVICAITSRYYELKSQIYPIAMHFAKNECSNALMHGFKSVELAQAFILLAFYSQPAKRWEEERGYVFGGLAMRMAIDLNLHIAPIAKPKTEKEEREQLNRIRLWMICFETDLNMAAHYGKPASLKENKIIRQSDEFYTRSEYVLVGDIGLAAYNKLLRVVYEFHTWAYSDPDSRTGLKKSSDFRSKGEEYDVKLDELSAEWTERFANYTKFQGDPIYDFRCSLLPYAVNYCRLVIFSFGFQQAFERGIQSSDRRFFEKCMSAAKAVVKVMVEKLAPSKYMKFAPTGWFNFSAFASAFLIKLLRPEFSQILKEEEKKEILSLIGRLTKVLASDDVKIDERHAPRLWARFLDDLVAKRTRENTMDEPQPSIPPTASASGVNLNATSPTAAAYVPHQQMHQQQYPTGLGQNGYVPQPMWSPVPPAMSWAQQQPVGGLGYAPATNGMGVPSAQPPFDYGASMVIDDDGTLAAMAAISDQGVFWDNMMMPGFSWPESPQSIQDLPVVDPQPEAAHAQQWYTTQ